jgi:mono/diheme cytochrome c family protein
MSKLLVITWLAIFLLGFSSPAFADINAEALFAKKCKMCHALDKKKTGPAVRDMKTDPEKLKEVIANGRKLMPKFGKKLSSDEISALAEYIVSKIPGANPCAAGNPCGK